MAQNVFIFTWLLSRLVMFNTGLEKTRVLKECAYVLTPPLVQLYSLCLNTSTFPQCWKHAHVQPIPKKGSRFDPSNYRPIALTCILSKIFETLLNSHFLDLSLIHISEPTRLLSISYAVFCLKKKTKKSQIP